MHITDSFLKNYEKFIYYLYLIWRKVIKGLGEVIEGKDPHKYIISRNNIIVQKGLIKLAQFIK